MKKVLLLIVMVMMVSFSMAVNVGDVIKKDGLEYKVLEDGITLEVSGYTSIPEKGEVIIPEMVDGMKVVKVGEKAFFGCNDLTSVEMPKVITVGKEAFYECKALRSVEMPVVETVGDCVFYECEKLIINNHIISTDEKGVMYRKDDNDNATVLNYTKMIKGELIIPVKIGINGKDYNVTAVGNEAFAYCGALTSVIMEGVETVGESAFRYCRALTSVEMQDVRTVGDCAFYECKDLRSVEMPVLETLIDGAFYGCEALTSVEMPKTGCCFNSYSFHNCHWQPSENGVTSSCPE